EIVLPHRTVASFVPAGSEVARHRVRRSIPSSVSPDGTFSMRGIWRLFLRRGKLTAFPHAPGTVEGAGSVRPASSSSAKQEPRPVMKMFRGVFSGLPTPSVRDWRGGSERTSHGPDNLRDAIDDPNVLLVHVTPFDALMWDNGRTPTRVIDHGVTVCRRAS